MAQLPESPIFIVGAPRSGTTLLRFILSSHPRIHVPAETGFIPFVGVAPDRDLEPGDIHRLLDRIGRLNRDWDEMVSDPKPLIASLPEPRLGCLLDALYRLKAEPYAAARWGDKTPAYVLHIPTLSRIFPSAQFVHLIRDGRDVTLSAAAKWGEGRWYMDSTYLLRNWKRYVERGRQAGRHLGADRYLELYYERLVEQPGPVVERLCAFLGEPFHPSMLDHTGLARKQIQPGGHVEVWGPITAAGVSRWQTEMLPFDQKVADRVAGRLLASLGYPLSSAGPLSALELARFSMLSMRFLLVDAGRRAGSRLGLLTLNRGKRRRQRPGPGGG